MNDNNEKWNDLINNTFKYPEQLTNVGNRFEMRIIRLKKRKRAFISSISTLAASLLFVLLVNTSTVFANAVSELPLISNLAEFVKFDKSLKKAIENEYVQEVNLVSWDGSNRLLLPYVIADKKNLVLFFQLPEEFDQDYNQWANIFLNNIKDGVTGEKIEGYSYTTSGLSSEGRNQNHGFIMQECHFLEDKLPKSIDIEVDIEIETIMESEESIHISDSNDVTERKPILEKIASYNFHIELDEFQEPKIYNINKTYTIIGQKIIVESMSVYPTGTEVNFSFPDENTAWVKGLELEVIQDGFAVYKGNDGFSSINDIENKKMSVFIESNYFDKPKKQELLIKAVRLLNKDEEFITVDIDNKTLTPNIEGSELKEVIRDNDKVTLVFSTKITDDDNHGMFNYEYKDTDGNVFNLNGEGTSSHNGQMETLVVLKYPTKGKVILRRVLTPKIYIKDPINIEIK